MQAAVGHQPSAVSYPIAVNLTCSNACRAVALSSELNADG